MQWKIAVLRALCRYRERHMSGLVDRDGLIREEMAQIIAETGSRGATPQQTLSRELQEIRDMGIIEFVDDHGNYRIVGDPCAAGSASI